ncbi:MAG: hypothetical protein AAGG68_01855 [Bacteroidota bacterium]
MSSTTSTEKDYQLIQRFFEFELNEEERTAVEERMATDKDFLQRMQIYRQMEMQVDSMGKSEQIVAKEVVMQPKIAKKSRWTTLQAAAAMLAIAIGLLFVFQLFNTKQPDVLAQQYWDSSEKVLFSNLRDAQVNQEVDQHQLALIDASVSFEAERYAVAFERLGAVLPDNVNYLKALLLKGQILFEQARYEEAIVHFQLIIEAQQYDVKDAAYWFQALSYLKLSKTEESKKNLNYIIEQKYPMTERAKELLEKL